MTARNSYDKSVDLLFDAWQRERIGHLEDVDQDMLPGLGNDLGVVRRAMERLALAVHHRQGADKQRDDAPADISKGEVLEAFETLLDQSGLKPAELLGYLDRHAGLLIAREDSGPYAFPHRSFQEYLAACEVCHQPGYTQKFKDLAEQDTQWRRDTPIRTSTVAPRPLNFLSPWLCHGDERSGSAALNPNTG